MTDYTADPWEEDPLEYLRTQNQYLQQQVSQLQNLAGAYANDRTIEKSETDFRSNHLGYDQAEQYLTGQLAKEAASMGYSDDDSIQVARSQVSMAKAGMAARGRDPASYVYETARIRGYDPSSAVDDMNDHDLDRLFDEMETQETARTGRSPGVRG